MKKVMTMFQPMRRSKQQLSDEQAIAMLERNTAGTLALLGEDGYPYAVPLSYVYLDGVLYFHSASSGHKIDAIKQYEKASFCVIDKDEIVPKAYTTYYKSVIAFGKVHIIDDTEQMRSILTALAMKYCADYEQGIAAEIDKYCSNMAVIALSIEHITGKASIELI